MLKFFKKNLKPTIYATKFLSYKNARKAKFPLRLNQIKTPCKRGLVSIIVPVYNGEKFLEDTLNSISAQTYANIELIIINDGSTDGSEKIIAEYATENPDTIVISQSNKRLPYVLTRGFDLADGEFVTWISCDNVILPNFIESMVEALKFSSETGMVYGNMRLIDEHGKTLRGMCWYEFPPLSGNVILPNNANELNIRANNTIGGAFLIRATAIAMVGRHSNYKFGTEDYDFWMRINEVTKIEHIKNATPLYLYRMHDESLTAKDEKLGITQNRYKLMALDDFRRDYFLSPCVWYIDGDGEGLAKLLKKAGHMVLNQKEANDFEFPKYFSNFIYVNFGGVTPCINIPKDAVKVCINSSEATSDYDIYMRKSCDDLIKIGDFRGTYGYGSTQALASFLETRVKMEIAQKLEGIIETPREYEKSLSLIICTKGESETLSTCIAAAMHQTCAVNNYEILVVNNALNFKSLNDNKYENVRYINAPIPGISYARNVGMWNSKGEYLLYIDDDAISDVGLVSSMIQAFAENPTAGVIGGEIILKIPPDVPADFVGKDAGLWSEFRIKEEGCTRVQNSDGFPYGANFCVRASSLMQLGGFKTSYGRVGNDFGGGEELQVCYAMKSLGMEVFVNKNAKVVHVVKKERFTAKHKQMTVFAARQTEEKLKKDLYKSTKTFFD
ncbi:MAG: glycosyltransferase [Oscillospiraceae bacterium]